MANLSRLFDAKRNARHLNSFAKFVPVEGLLMEILRYRQNTPDSHLKLEGIYRSRHTSLKYRALIFFSKKKSVLRTSCFTDTTVGTKPINSMLRYLTQL